MPVIKNPDNTKNKSTPNRAYCRPPRCGKASRKPEWPMRTKRIAAPLRPSNCGIYPGTKKDFAIVVFSIVRGAILYLPSFILGDSSLDSIRETTDSPHGSLNIFRSLPLLGALVSHLNIFLACYDSHYVLGIPCDAHFEKSYHSPLLPKRQSPCTPNPFRINTYRSD